ncbi:protein yippee-like At5g53940 [Nicotiana tabacum]|uniref:Protein yippee-like n=1 Tax=Nicotiana tabacum TaxID=4097 RepID=A0A1S4AHR0_TOBAC
MGRLFLVDLEGKTVNCKICKTQLALTNNLMLKDFICHKEKAYLFRNVVNITFGPNEEKMILSEMHTIADIFCCCCGQIVGWKYVATPYGNNHKCKEGNFVLEKGHIFFVQA